MYITDNTIKRLKQTYAENKANLEELEDFIEEHGMTNEGLTDVTESFEQGWNNAMEYVFSVLDINFR